VPLFLLVVPKLLFFVEIQLEAVVDILSGYIVRRLESHQRPEELGIQRVME